MLDDLHYDEQQQLAHEEEERKKWEKVQLPPAIYHQRHKFVYVGYDIDLYHETDELQKDWSTIGKQVGLSDDEFLILRILFQHECYKSDGSIDFNFTRKYLRQKYSKADIGEVIFNLYMSGAIKYADEDSQDEWVRGPYDFYEIYRQCKLFNSISKRQPDDLSVWIDQHILKPLNLIKPSWDSFLSWQKKTKDIQVYRNVYTDMMGGKAKHALLLSHILYWHLPDAKGNSKLEIMRDGKEWIACTAYGWWDRLRLSPNEAGSAIKNLHDQGFIDKATYQFNKLPTTHIHLVREVFLRRWYEIVDDGLEEWDSFLSWESSAKDVQLYRNLYTDMAGGKVKHGLVLAHVVFWHLPNRQGKSKLRIFHNDKWWMARTRKSWSQELRLKPNEVDTAIDVLVDLGILEKVIKKFDKFPTVHIRIVKEAFVQRWHELIYNPPKNPHKSKP